MFGIHESYWVSMATLNFLGSAKGWLHVVRKKLQNLDWNSFCTLLSTRSGRDRHQLLIRQFYSLKQHDTVAEYIERFSARSENISRSKFLKQKDSKNWKLALGILSIG